MREILFIVASVVGRYEPDFIAFQQRLSAAGKPRKVIRIALAHKLLVRLNAKAREVRLQHRRELAPCRSACAKLNSARRAAAGVVGKRKTASSFSVFSTNPS